MNQNQNTTRCKHQKIVCGLLLSLLLPHRIVLLLLKIEFPLKFSIKEGWNYIDDQGEVGKLRTTGSQKTGQVLGPRHAKVLLALGEMTSEDSDLAMALSSGSKDLDDGMQELAARVMDEARKDPESVIVQEPWFSQLNWRPKKKNKVERPGNAERARHLLAKMVMRLDESQKWFTSRHNRSHASKLNCTFLVQAGVERLPFVSFEGARLDILRSIFRLRDFQARIVSDVLQPCRFDPRQSISSRAFVPQVAS